MNLQQLTRHPLYDPRIWNLDILPFFAWRTSRAILIAKKIYGKENTTFQSSIIAQTTEDSSIDDTVEVVRVLLYGKRGALAVPADKLVSLHTIVWDVYENLKK